MKRYMQYGVLFFTIVALTGCTSWLRIKPYTEAQQKEFDAKILACDKQYADATPEYKVCLFGSELKKGPWIAQ